MLLSVDHCHRNGVIHRDVKLENFLVCRNKTKGSAYGVTVKLTDFGLSCEYDEEDPPNHYCGTITSMAPEIITGKTYDYKVDSFSLGVALYELITEKMPFQGPNKEMIKQEILRKDIVFDHAQSPIWDTVDKDVKDLITRLTMKDPRRRIGVR